MSTGNDWLGEVGAIAGIAGQAAVAAGKGVAAGALGGPAGMAAGGLVGLASAVVPHIFGEDAKPALAAAAQAITGAAAEPEQVQELASDPTKLDAFRVQALQIAQTREAARDQAQVDTLKAQLGDVQDARAVDIERHGLLSYATLGISLLFLLLWAGSLLLNQVGHRTVDPDDAATLRNIAIAVAAYWIGSSAGSAFKTSVLARRGS